MTYTARDFVLHEASYRQLLKLRPNVAVLPWGATEAHNYHLPHGTDVVEGTAVGEAAVKAANAKGGRVVLLPAVPFGIDHSQLSQVATVTMRASTQAAVLTDVAESMVRQGIDRLVVLNYHGGNEFKSIIRDVMLDLPLFIVQVHGYQLDPNMHRDLGFAPGEHGDEFETSLMLHLRPEWVADLSTAGPGKPRASKLQSLSQTPGVWVMRDWEMMTSDTGVGDPRGATADRGAQALQRQAAPLARLLVELSKARNGDFPYIVRPGGVRRRSSSTAPKQRKTRRKRS